MTGRRGARPAADHRARTAAVAAALLVLGACGGADTDGVDADVRADSVAAASAWVRVAIGPDPGEADAPPANTAAYFVLQNLTDVPEALIRVETPIADTAEIHSVTMDEGVMRMRAVDSVAVPAHGEAVLEPGGHHVMLIGLRNPLTEGDSVALRLQFRSRRVVDVTAPVRRSPPF